MKRCASVYAGVGSRPVAGIGTSGSGMSICAPAPAGVCSRPVAGIGISEERMKICVPVAAATNEAALALMDRALAGADLVEIRLDAIREPDLKRLLRGRRDRVLVTNRSAAEGGAFDGPEARRVALLREAVALGAAYVDIEAATDAGLFRSLRETLRDRGGATKLVVSWHDTAGTPSARALRKKVRELMALKADVVKLVTRAESVADAFRVLELIPAARRQGQEIVAFAMGPRGRASRLLSVLVGASWTFAALAAGAESAPGQMTVAETRQSMSVLARGAQRGRP